MNEGCAGSGWCSSENFLNRFDWFVKAPASTKVYKIFTVFDLIGFADIVNGHDLPEGVEQTQFEGKMVLLESDLDLAEVCEHMEWSPIGDNSVEPSHIFAGIFNGKSHTISNLKLNTVKPNPVAGLFGYVGLRAKVLRLNVKNVDVHCVGGYAGGLAAYSRGTFEWCSVVGAKVFSEGGIAGGVVGQLYDGFMYGCYFDGELVHGDYAGGMVGWSNFGSVTSVCSCKIKEISASGGTEVAGGIAAYNVHSSVTSCIAVVGSMRCSIGGGVVGLNQNLNTGAVTDVSGCRWMLDNVNNGVGKNDRGTTSDVLKMSMAQMNEAADIEVLNKQAQTTDYQWARRESNPAGDVPGISWNVKYVEFDDPLFREYVVKNFDFNGDGEISSDEALIVDGLDFYYNEPDRGKIRSLKGLEYFKNIKRLQCANHHISHLDLSENKWLEDLWCHDNDLEELDLSHNHELKFLRCWSNRIQTIDVSRNLKMDVLYCNNMPSLRTLIMAEGQNIRDVKCDSQVEIKRVKP